MKILYRKASKLLLTLTIFALIIIFPAVYLYSSKVFPAILEDRLLFQQNILLGIVILLLAIPSAIFLYLISFEKRPKRWYVYSLPLLALICCMVLWIYSTSIIRSSSVLANDGLPTDTTGLLQTVEGDTVTFLNPLWYSYYFTYNYETLSSKNYIVRLTLENDKQYAIAFNNKFEYEQYYKSFNAAIGEELIVSALPNSDRVLTIMTHDNDANILFHWHDLQ